ncbi:MAG: phasin family protein [Rhodospirillaceae bacterium]|nr:phasin family protein [Rhodospirillaceae bacterium]
MKRIDIDKPGTSGTQAETAPAMEQAAWQEAWTLQLGRTAEIYGKLFAAMRDEAAGFVQKRIEADMETAKAWSTCRTMNDLLDLQQKWLHCAVEHYTEQGMKMAELCQRTMSEPAETVAAAAPAEAAQPKPAERKTAAQAEAGVSRAA